MKESALKTHRTPKPFKMPHVTVVIGNDELGRKEAIGALELQLKSHKQTVACLGAEHMPIVEAMHKQQKHLGRLPRVNNYIFEAGKFIPEYFNKFIDRKITVTKPEKKK